MHVAAAAAGNRAARTALADLFMLAFICFGLVSNTLGMRCWNLLQPDLGVGLVQPALCWLRPILTQFGLVLLKGRADIGQMRRAKCGGPNVDNRMWARFDKKLAGARCVRASADSVPRLSSMGLDKV